MIHGHKPSANFVTFTGDGQKIEGECRQCIHCQYTWTYAPGSGIQRGWCLRCSGFLCARPECHAQQILLIDMMREQHNQTRSCVPFEEWVNRLRDRLMPLLPLSPDLTVTETGLIIPR